MAAFGFCHARKRGYLPGAGDDTVASLQQLGYTVTTLKRRDDLTAENYADSMRWLLVPSIQRTKHLAANLPAFRLPENAAPVIVQYKPADGCERRNSALIHSR